MNNSLARINPQRAANGKLPHGMKVALGKACKNHSSHLHKSRINTPTHYAAKTSYVAIKEGISCFLKAEGRKSLSKQTISNSNRYARDHYGRLKGTGWIHMDACPTLTQCPLYSARSKFNPLDLKKIKTLCWNKSRSLY